MEYKSKEAYYFVKDNKILMYLKSAMYRISKNFMIGAEYFGPLTFDMKKEFETCYTNATNW